MQSPLNLYSILKMPVKPGIVPINSQWLSGEGAGSWFYIEVSEKNYKMTRFSQEGKVECSGQFKITNQTNFDVNGEFKFTYLSHCKTLNIAQGDLIITMGIIG